jgi:hypothetical protein
MYCPLCGTKNDPGVARCTKCGAEMPGLTQPKKRLLAFYPGQGVGCIIGIAALGIISLAVILPQYRLYQLQLIASREALVRNNMRSLRVALEQYAAESEQYPATFEPDNNDPYGPGIEYLAMTARRMRDPFDPLVPAVIVSLTDPPDWKQVKTGQIIYVPLQVDHGRARGYIIYGMSKDWPINDVMRGGYGQ